MNSLESYFLFKGIGDCYGDFTSDTGDPPLSRYSFDFSASPHMRNVDGSLFWGGGYSHYLITGAGYGHGIHTISGLTRGRRGLT